MLKQKYLKFKNIGRFVEEQTIEFDSFGNLIQLDAQNNNTHGGSSGSGKTTIFHANDWLLGLSDLSNGILQSRLTKDHMWAQGLYDWDGKTVLIDRGKKLSITLDGVETTGSSKITEELLDKIIGMPRHLFRVLTHKRQGEMGFFLQLTPAKMNEFLTDCAGLGSISFKIELVDEKIKNLSTGKTNLESDLKASQAALEATVGAIDSLGLEPASSVSESALDLLKNERQSLQLLLEKALSNHKEELNKFNESRPKLVSIPFDDSTLNALEVEQKELDVQINVILEKEKDRQSTVNKEINDLKLESNNKIHELKVESNNKFSENRTQISKLKQVIQIGNKSKESALKIAGQLKTLKDGICHTCEQSWITQKSKDEEQRLLQELGVHRTNIVSSIEASEEISTLESTLNTLSDHYDVQIANITKDTKDRGMILLEEFKPKVCPELEVLNAKLNQNREFKAKEKEKEFLHNKQQSTENEFKLQAFFNEQKALTNKQEIDRTDLSKLYDDINNKYNETSRQFLTHKQLKEEYQKNTTSLKNKKNDINSKLVHITSKLVDLIQDLEIAEEAKKCLKFYLSCSFDDALTSISDTATKILRAIPTMANATIRLDSTKETNNGSIKEQINACLDSDGELNIPIKSLSGGERSAVDLAVDLAVCEMIQEKTNNGCNIMVLDEPFGGFDSIGIEHALEMLKMFSADRKILLVEHDPIAKEFIQDRITVIRENETSYIK